MRKRVKRKKWGYKNFKTRKGTVVTVSNAWRKRMGLKKNWNPNKAGW